MRCFAAICQKRCQHGTSQSVSSDCTSCERSLALPSSKGCKPCRKFVNSTTDGCMNGKVGCSSDIACATTSSASGSPSCRSSRNKLNCERHEWKKSPPSHKSSEAAVSPCKITEHECKTCAVTKQDCVPRLSEGSPRSRPRFTVEVQAQKEKLSNGTDGSWSDEVEQSGQCKAEVTADDRACENVELRQSAVDTSGVSESARQNILDAAETFASIIGREIAASFGVKDGGEQSPAECPGDGLSLTRCSAAGSTAAVQPGFKLLSDDRRTESDGEPPLDTVDVARRVRYILTMNNVGQRQFARYVLGLSQGTVSELLAKPKPWDRLTEKGKESYRRMNKWADDHLGVLTLKDHLSSVALKASLPPPKGSSSCIFSLCVMGALS